MVQKVDYYALLSRAVESLERDAYAARGAIYDREHKALLKRLISSSAPCSDADIVREERAFRDAVRRIEFPDDVAQAPRTPLRETAEAAWPASGRERARALRREFPQAPANEPGRPPPPEARRAAKRRWGPAYWDTGRNPPARQSVVLPGELPDDDPGWNGKARKPRSSFAKLAAAYLLVTAVVLGAGALGYAYVAGTLNLGWLPAPGGEAAPKSERAVLYEGGQSGQTGKPVEGTAIWRTRTQTNGAGNPDTVVTLDVEIPEQRIALTMTISRVTDAGSGMSHLLELKFARPADMPLGGISRVSNIALKAAEADAGESLVGTSINIAPGQFMFGLLGVEDVVKQNIQRLRTQSWLDFALVFENGAAYTLTVEKGASGERAINDALAKWGQ